MKLTTVELICGGFFVAVLVALAILIALVGDQAMDRSMMCSLSSAASWRDVRTEIDESAVEGCERIAEVEATGAYIAGTASADKEASELAIRRLKKATWQLGGDTVLVISIESNHGRAKAVGVAYSCN